MIRFDRALFAVTAVLFGLAATVHSPAAEAGVQLLRGDGSGGQKAIVIVGDYATLALALAAANPGDTVQLGANTYNESGLIVEDNNLTIRGAAPAESNGNPWNREPVSFIDGNGAATWGLRVMPGVTGVVLQDFEIREFAGNCLWASGGNNGLRAQRLRIHDCQAGSGGAAAFVAGPVNDVQFVDNEIFNAVNRGIVVWNGFKTNLLFSGNYIHDMSGCCALELQDGSASGVRVLGNRIERTGDNGIGLIGLTSGGGAPFNGENRIADNLLINTGRYGIEIKLPNGSGLASGDGSIVVEDNAVWLAANGDPDFDGNVLEHTLVPGIVAYKPTEERDLGGIIVMRRGLAEPVNVETPAGVIIRDNTVGGWQQDNAASDSTGFGIVIGGIKHVIENNTLIRNDVAIQRQAGHTPYCVKGSTAYPQPGSCDGNQNDVADQFFGRDNSQLTCAAVGTNTFDNNVEAMTRNVSAGAGQILANTVLNQNTGLPYCNLQSAIDDPYTLDGHVLVLSDDAVYAERVVVSKRLRLTRNNAGTNPPLLRAPATAGDLAIVRVSAPDVEIDHLDFSVDLKYVGEAIRSTAIASQPEPDGLHIHHNRITATASTGGPGTFVAFGRRNALSLNLSPANNYALPGEQVVTLTVNVHDNVIRGTQDWDPGVSTEQSAAFRSGVGIDQGEGSIRANDIFARDYDLFVRYTNGAAGLDIGGATVADGNTLRGAGLYVGDGNTPVRIRRNVFAPDRVFLPYSDLGLNFRFGDLGSNAIRLVNASAAVEVSNNTISDHTNGVFAQNFVNLALNGNTFNVPTHGAQFRHVILSTKVMSSGSAGVTQVPLANSASGNTFNGSGSHADVAVEFANHDADNASYGALDFNGNTFAGDFDFYFRLDPTSCATSQSCAPLPYPNYGYATTPNTIIAPFGGDVQAANNTFAGVAPAAMNLAQLTALQQRTYHDDPNAPETPAVPAALGRVLYTFADDLIPTTTIITSTSPSPSAVNAAVTVNVSVTNALGGNPFGTVAITAPEGQACNIAYPTQTSCNLGGFPTGGVKTITATFTPTETVNQASNGSATHAVTFPSMTTVPVSPAGTPTATDNDYTRINNAILAAGPGVQIVLSGQFDFAPSGLRAAGSNADPSSFAWQSFRAGSNGVFDNSHFGSAAGGDDFSIRIPNGTRGFTVTAPTIGGATILAPGDQAADNGAQSVFLAARDPLAGGSRSFENITVSNLVIAGFDAGLFFRRGAGNFHDEIFTGSRINNNVIRVPRDLDGGTKRGIYVSYGGDQQIDDNDILIDLAGSVAGGSVVGIQAGDSSNTNAFDGLRIRRNDVTASGSPLAANTLIAIWENAMDGDSDIRIEGNLLRGSGNLGGLVAGVELNNQYGVIAGTQGNGAKIARLANNDVRGFETGYIGQLPIYGHYVGGEGGLAIESNTFVGNGTALHLAGAYDGSPDSNFARYTVRYNRIAGNVIGLLAEDADDLPAAGDPGYGGDEKASQIDARDNWWGCNEGPAGAACNDLVIETGAVPADTPVVQQDSWLVLRGLPVTSNVTPPNPAPLTVDVVTNNLGATVGAAFPNGTPIALAATKGTLNPPSPIGTTSGAIATNLEGHVSGYSFVTATLDAQTVTMTVVVPGPVTVSKGTGVHLNAAATCGAPDFATIQAAVNTVPPGTEILVCSGTYAENLVVNKQVALRGAQAGTDARNRSAAEAIIVPASIAPGMSLNDTSLPVVELTANGIVFDGFVVDGNNPLLTSGVLLNGADVDRSYGIDTEVDNLLIRGSILRNFVFAGIYAVETGTAVVEQNLFQNITAPGGFGIGIYAGNNFYVRLLQNRMDQVSTGFQVGNNHQPAPGGFVPTVADNEIRAASTGIFYNLVYANGTPYSIANNDVFAQANPGRTGQWRGIWLESLQTAQTAAVTGNDIDGSAVNAARQSVGYLANNITSSNAANVAISGGTVTGVDVGAMSTDATFYTGPVNDLVVRNVAFGAIDYAAFYVEDTTETAGSARLTIGAGNSYAGSANYLVMSGVAPVLGFADGVTSVPRVFVRSARNYFYGLNAAGGSPCTVCTVPSTPVNPAIAAVAAAGTVSLEAGTFPHAIAANKAVTLSGPHAGTAGDAAGRGTGEATITPPAATTALEITASNVIVDGLEFANITHHRIVQRTAGGTAGLRIANSRFVDYTATNGNSGGFVIGGAVGMVIERNLFEDFLNGGAGNAAMGLKLDSTVSPIVRDNVFRRVQSVAIQMSQNSGAPLVEDNLIDGETLGFTNAGIQVFTSANVTVQDNVFTGTAQGLLFMRGNSNLRFTCNTVANSTRGVRAAIFGTVGSEASPAIFHNVLPAANAVVNEFVDTLTVGSNYYGGAAPTTSGTAPRQVADALPATPIGNPACGNNTATNFVAYGGGGQSANLNQPFALPLRARTQDALFGAVAGQGVTFAVPPTGASAQLTPPAGTTIITDFNGVAASSAIANGFAGTYNVRATHALGIADFALTNVELGQVYLDVNGPVAGVQVGETVLYRGTLANQSAPVNEPVVARIEIAGATSAADVQACVRTSPSTCTPVTLAPGPAPGTYSATLGAPFNVTPTPFGPLNIDVEVVFARAAIYSATIRIVGNTSGTLYASDMITTEVSAEHAGVSIDITGPVSGVERGEPTEYAIDLTNVAAPVADPVFVELVFTRDGGDWSVGDLVVEQGAGNFLTLTIDPMDASIMTAVLDPGSITLGTTTIATSLTITHNVPDTYRIAATVRDFGSDSDGVDPYATDLHTVVVIEPDPNVELTLEGLFATTDGTTPVGGRVDVPAIVRGELVNSGGLVPQPVHAAFTLAADFGPLDVADVSASYWFVPALSSTCAPVPPANRTAITFTDTGATLTAVTDDVTMTAGYELAACFEIEFAKPGVYNLGGVIEDASATPYAADNLAIVIEQSDASIALGGLGTFTFDGNPHGASVSTTPPGLLTTTTYSLNGGTPTTTVPVEAGVYTVNASINAGQGYEGSAAGTITIVPKPITIALAGGGTYTYDGTQRVATASTSGVLPAFPLGAPLQVTYNGSATAPSDVGSYAVTAFFNPALVRNYTALPAVTTIGIVKRTVPVSFVAATLQQDFGSTGPVGVNVTLPPPPADQGVDLVEVRYDGSLVPPTAVGTYLVTAQVFDPNYEGNASATLVISDGADVSLSIAPLPTMALLGTHTPGFSDPIAINGTLANAGTVTSQEVHYRLRIARVDDGNGTGGNPVAIVPDDVKVCVYDPSGYAAQAPNHDGCPVDYQFLFESVGSLDGRAAVELRYPNLAQNDAVLPPLPPTPLPANLRLRPGEYLLQVDVVGSDNGFVYATAVANTVTVPNADITYSGALSGEAEDVLLSQTRLRNTGGRVDGNVIVRVTLSDASSSPTSPVVLNPGAADLLYQLGAGYQPLPWAGNAADGGLVTYFGPPSVGFPLEDGYDATTAAAGVFHRLGTYRLRYEVLDLAQTTVYAQRDVTITIAANAVNFALSDLEQVYDGTPRAVTVSPSNVPHTVVYEALTGESCPLAPAGGNTTPPTNAGSYCVYVTANGSYSGSASGVLVISQAPATVFVTDAIAGVVQRAYDGTPQVVTASSNPAVAAIAITYNGSPTAPSAAGSYAVLATVVDPNYYGSASAMLVIAIDGGATIVLDDDDGTIDAIVHRTYDGAAQDVGAIVTPATVTYAVTYRGINGTAYPLTATAPVDAGQYEVIARTTDANYATVSATGTLIVEPATAQITIAPASLSATYDGNPHGVGVTTDPAGLDFTVTYNGGGVPTAAGTYAVVVTIDERNYVGTANATLVIAPAAGGLGVADVTATYDGLPHGVTVTNPNGITFTVSYAGTTAGGAAYGPTATAPTDAGDYTATVTETDANFDQAPITANVDIAPAPVSLAFGNLAHVYDGTAKAASVTSTPSGVPGIVLSYAPDATPINAGSYTVTASLANPNYIITSGNTATLVIAKATAQVSLGDLTRLYDGTPKPVTVTTTPAGLSVSVTYDGSITAPSAVGSYAVVATINEVNYTGSASGTLSIVAAAITGFAIDGPSAFTGIAGAPLATGPRVRVTDGSGNGVPSVTVQFDVTAGGGSVANNGQATTDANGYANAPAWTLGRDAGANTMTARVAGLAGLPTLTFTAQGAESTDLAIAMQVAQDEVEAGDAAIFTITVTNNGPSNAQEASITDVLPARFSGATWTCTGNGGALCGVTANANGTGDIALDAKIPAGASLVIVLTATVDANSDIGALVNTATVAAVSGDDPVGANDSASATIEVLPQGGAQDGIFGDGFESP